MAEITLKAELGRPTGTRASRRLRAEGRIPATVYGLGRDPQTVSVAWRELRPVLTTDAGLNAVFDLEIEGEKDLVMVKDLQRHPIRRDVLHVDFLRISRDVAISVEVPVVLVGEAEKVLRENGLVDPVLNTLTITAKPGDIPNEITVDVSNLELGDRIHVGDIQLPPGVTTDLDPEEVVVTTSAGSTEEAAEGEAVEGEEAEGGAPAEAEGGEPAGDGGGGDEGGGDAGSGEG